jgi:hypothetical protein
LLGCWAIAMLPAASKTTINDNAMRMRMFMGKPLLMGDTG